MLFLIFILFALSLFFRSQNKIEFLNPENMDEILQSFSVAPYQPGIMCAVSSSMLVYEDCSKNPRQLHWLDCSEPEPKLLGITADLNLSYLQDMCTVELENETLIVLPNNVNEQIQAYNITTGQLKWSVQKMPNQTWQSYSVAGDGNGHFFVADYTYSGIKMFSASDGQYLGCFMNKGDHGLGDVYRLRWCEATSSLLVAHSNGWTGLISDIH